MNKSSIVLGFSLIFCVQAVLAEPVAKNTLELQSTFKGNQEQPNVTYIVPWKKIQAPPAAYQPLDSLIGSNFEFIDRDEFRRGVSYRTAIDELGQAPGSPAENQ